MEPLEILLDRIDANPWNPRMGEDPEHIKGLALSIAQGGLMQIPVGRLVDTAGKPCTSAEAYRVQLAFGHSRLAAFKWLEAVKENSNLLGDWSRMPVIIREMDDLEMAEKALEENMQRKDLNAIEEARAMDRLRKEFALTSAQIGEKFHLAESTVRNKMRLLALPEFLQDALRRGELSEGAGRALIPLYDIPEAARLDSEDGDELKPSEILEAARSGLAPARVAEMVSALAERLAPRPEQLPIFPGMNSGATLPAAERAREEESVSVETLEDDDESADNEESPESDAGLEDEDEKQMDLPATPLERVFAPVMPTPTPKPAPIPTPAPARPAQPAPVQAKPAPAPAPKPEPKPQPAPTPAPAPAAAAVTWEGSTILLSLTLWPEDAHGNRMVSIGGRLNQGSPRMALASLADVELPRQLLEMMEQLKGGLA